MAFKVLLADDSAAIKKVVQLSLQDFGAEIKSVGSGKDVLDVCRSFKPDIAFVDVLLPHKTGYEIAGEIKKDKELKTLPVVMLWSAFMAFDEGKFKASGADARLEKPFEVAGLRSLVTKLVPKLMTNPIMKHLEFPKLDFEEPIGAVPPTKLPSKPIETKPMPKAPATPPIEITPPAEENQKEEWSMASFDDIGSFTNQMKSLQEKDAPASKGPAAPTPPIPIALPEEHNFGGEEEQWVRKDVTSKYKVPVPAESEDENTVEFRYTDSQISDTSFLFKPPSTAPTNPVIPNPDTSEHTLTATEVLPPPTAEKTSLTEMDMEKFRTETREIVEKVVWKLVPEIASQIIREEIQRLLGDEK